MALEFEWGENYNGDSILLAKKSRGKISIKELQEELCRKEQFCGAWAVIVRVREDGGYQGWGDIEEPKGDVIELYRVDDYEKCPICAAVYNGVTY